MSYEPNFTKAVAFTLEREGVLSYAASDPGGLTKYGISKASYPALDIANITKEQAIEIYYTDFWRYCNCSSLPFAFALSVFECAVNQGRNAATKLLQQSIGVTPDGNFGPASKAALLLASSSSDVLASFLALRVQRYVAIKDSNPTEYAEDNKGWFKRLFLCIMVGVQ